MRAQLPGLNARTVFAALEARSVGRQTLEILEAWDLRIEPLRGPIPFVGENTVVFLGTDLLRFPSRYLRMLPKDPSPDRVSDAQMCRIAAEMGLRHREAVRVVFINERYVGPSGMFEGSCLENFTHALAQLCGRESVPDTRRSARAQAPVDLSASERRELGIAATRSARCETWC